MSYTTPPTFVPDDELTADQLNILSDDISDLDARAHETAFQGVSLFRGSNQSIPDNSSTAITWSTASLDVGGWWSSGTDIVVPSDAIPDGFTSIYVECHGQTRFGIDATGYRYIAFYLNGSIIEAEFSGPGLAADITSLAHTVWAEVEAGDIITMELRQTSGGALNASTNSAKVKRLGPAS